MKPESDEEARKLIAAAKDADAAVREAREAKQKQIEDMREVARQEDEVVYHELMAVKRKEGELEQQRREIAEAANAKEKEIELATKEEVMRLAGAREEVNRIVRLIELSRGMREFDPELELKAYRYGQEKPIIPIQEIRKTPFTLIRAYVVENDRPKNKYQVEVVGRTIFSQKDKWNNQGDIADMPREYGAKISASGDNIHWVIGVAASQEAALKQWNAKWTYQVENSAWLKSIIGMEAKLQEVLDGKYGSVEWQREYLLSQVDYYEHRYTGGTKTPEYAAIIRELGELEHPIDTSTEAPDVTKDEKRMDELETMFESYIHSHPNSPKDYMLVSILMGHSDEYYRLLKEFNEL